MILPMLLICLVAGHPPAPPYLPGATIKVAPGASQTPKYREFRASLGSRMIRRNIPPKRLSFVPSGFSITNITVHDGQTTIGWQQGTGPYQIEGKMDLLAEWSPVSVGPTMLQNKTFPAAQNHFWRIRSQVDLLQISTNQPRLTWAVPEIAMSDVLGPFNIYRRTAQPTIDDPNDFSEWGPPVVSNLPNTTRAWTDGTAVGTGLWYKLKQVTANGVIVPYPVKQLLPSSQPPGSVAWARQGGGTLADGANCIAKNADGSFIVVGYFKGTANFGTPGHTAADLTTDPFMTCIFIVKYDNDGNHVWSVKYGNSAALQPFAVALDSFGNIYVCGYYFRSVNLGGATFNASGGDQDYDAWIAKYDTLGGHLWSHSFGTSALTDNFSSLKINSLGQVIVCGTFVGKASGGTLSFGTPGHPAPVLVNPEPTIANSPSQTLVCFDGSGNYVWQKMLESNGELNALAVDSSDNIYITGHYVGYVRIDSGPVITAPSPAKWLLVAKLSPTGSYVSGSGWYRGQGSGNQSFTIGRCITLDTITSSVFIGGSLHIATDFGNGVVTSSDNSEQAFIVKYSRVNGAWVAQYVTHVDFQSNVQGMVCDSSGNLYGTGYFAITCDFGGKTLGPTLETSNDIFVAKYNNVLQLTSPWPTWIGGSLPEKGFGMVVDNAQNPVVVGIFAENYNPITPGHPRTPVMFGSIALQSYGSTDAFIMKLNR